MSETQTGLVDLGRALRNAGYSFTTPTPATHATVNARPENCIGKSLSEVFGWSRPFESGTLPGEIEKLASEAGVISRDDGISRSTVRFSTLDDLLFVHSVFPTVESDAVFFGPDTYRFARVLKRIASVPSQKSIRVIDIGCGSGAGGIYLASLLRARCDVDLVLGDINEKALRLSAVNAALNDCDARILRSDVLTGIDGGADLIVANPPYLLDGAKRLYRHGDGNYGEGLSVRIVRESLPRLNRRGRLVLYTGTAILDGVDIFRREVEPVLKGAAEFDYEVIDPDVFGDELVTDAYRHADRIAAVALTVRRERV